MKDRASEAGQDEPLRQAAVEPNWEAALRRAGEVAARIMQRRENTPLPSASETIREMREERERSMDMSELEVIEQLLAQMSRGEKAQVLQWVVRDLGDAFPGIDSTASVCGGEPRIVRTRIPVWVLVQARRLGATEADLLRNYPGLRAEELANAWGYARAHPDEIEQQIRENETA
jgi:uncharacterized protein (DUF433 family)